MTSEEQHGISPQPPETCPIAAEAQASAAKIKERLRGFAKQDLEDLRDNADWSLWYLEDILKQVESLREANEAIRRWGQEWKDLAKRLSRSQNPESIYRKAEAADPAQP